MNKPEIISFTEYVEKNYPYPLSEPQKILVAAMEKYFEDGQRYIFIPARYVGLNLIRKLFKTYSEAREGGKAKNNVG